MNDTYRSDQTKETEYQEILILKLVSSFPVCLFEPQMLMQRLKDMPDTEELLTTRADVYVGVCYWSQLPSSTALSFTFL